MACISEMAPVVSNSREQQKQTAGILHGRFRTVRCKTVVAEKRLVDEEAAGG
jgi:hypothetical protein